MLDFSKGSKPKSNRIKFEMSDSITLVVENEYCKIYNDTRSGKPFKVINDEVVPLELKELNMWKNRQKNPGNFVVDVINDENGKVYDYVISRASANGANAQNIQNVAVPGSSQYMPAPSNAPTAIVNEPQKQPVQQNPALSAAPVSLAAAPQAQPTSSGTTSTRMDSSPKPSRIKFENTPTTELVLQNEFFKLYKDTRSGKTFKVINDEVAPIELRELNMWKNRQKTPTNFSVEIVKGADGQIYDYVISRVSAPAQVKSSVNEENTANASNNVRTSEPQPDTANTNRTAPAPASGKHVPSVTTSVGTPPTDRVKFEASATTEVVVENEFCKIYKNTRSGKTFKVINDMIAPIELRELNMWKNRQKNPGGFTVEIIKDNAGTPFDYIISRINEDGTLTKAPAVAPVAPYVPPENDYVPTTNTMTSGEARAKSEEPAKPAQVFPVGKPNGALPVKESSQKGPAVVDRIKFEETPTMSVVVENEFFKIYNDSRRGKTFKVIEGKVAPIELRELNMWKNRQRKPKNFAIEIVRTESGEVYDYIITRTEHSTTAAVESTSTKTNMPPVSDAPNSNVAAKKRRPNSSRILKCAICGKEYNESELLLFDNRNFCSSCIEELIKEKLDFKPVDPIQKVIDDVVGADELYCTYSTVTNYPYLDEEFCVNVCTVKKAADILAEDTAVQTIDDKDIFFDDLKRFGLKKIIVNGDSSHVFEPQDFDEHIKTEGVIAPKLYFKILNFMQRKDDDLRERIAESFLKSKVYTYALNDEITEITEENIDDFKPLTITDGYAKFCPVFTDFTEARSVGMPFRGLYEIDARLLTNYQITHFIINPSSLGFIMNKSILKMVDSDNAEIVQQLSDVNPAEDEKPAEEKAPVEEKIVPETEAEEPAKDEFIADAKEEFEKTFAPIAVEEVVPEPEAPAVNQPAERIEEQIFTQPTPPAASVADQFFAQPAPSATPIPTEPPTPPEPSAPAAPAQKKPVSVPDIVIKSDNTDGTKKTLKVSMPIFIPDDPEADIETNTSVSSSLQNAIKKSQSMFGENSSAFSSNTFDKPVNQTVNDSLEKSAESSENLNSFTFSDIMNGLAPENEGNDLDLSNLMLNTSEEQPEPQKPKLSIQLQATEAKVIARDLEIEPDLRVAQILRDQLNESYKKLAKMIAEADVMYAEFDSNTKHILIDGNNKGHIFSEKLYADKSVENFAKNGIDVYYKEYKNEDLFTMLYEFKRHGIQDLVLDETANWVIISTDTIAEMLDVNERKFVPIPVSNPELMFSMTTLFQKLQSKNDNPKRKQEIQSLEKLMIREFTSARYILPMVAYKENGICPLSIDGKNGVKRVLVFSDAFEMKRFFGDKIGIVKDYEIITYKELIKRFTVMSNTVVVLNEGSLRFEFNDHNCDHINKIMNQ